MLEHYYSKSAYDRVGREIKRFLKDSAIHIELMDGIGLEKVEKNPVPLKILNSLRSHCKKHISKLTEKAKGNYSEDLEKTLAILFLAITGCRPIEAAWVVAHGTVEQNTVNYRYHDLPYIIQMPSVEKKDVKKGNIHTKTKHSYKWLIPGEYRYFIDAHGLVKNTLTF